MIAEFGVLLGVENFEQSRGRIPPPIGSHFVEFVEEHHGIPRASLSERLDDSSGHCSHVGPTVAANLGFVPHPAKGDAHKFSIERTGDGLAQRCLACPRRSHETKNRPLQVAL